MALVVEDGTGLSNADSYLSVADAKAYWDARGLSYSASDTVIEQKLRVATDYIDSKWRFKAAKLVAAQALEWPRDGLIDWSGNEISGIPQRLKNALAELAYVALTEDLFVSLDRGGQIKSESVGPISVTYADGAPAGKSFTAAERMLAQYVRDPKTRGVPYYGGATTGAIALGGMDNPDAADPAEATE